MRIPLSGKTVLILKQRPCFQTVFFFRIIAACRMWTPSWSSTAPQSGRRLRMRWSCCMVMDQKTDKTNLSSWWPTRQTSSDRGKFQIKVRQPRYNTVDCLQNTHNKHRTVRPWGEVWEICCGSTVWFCSTFVSCCIQYSRGINPRPWITRRVMRKVFHMMTWQWYLESCDVDGEVSSSQHER